MNTERSPKLIHKKKQTLNPEQNKKIAFSSIKIRDHTRYYWKLVKENL